MGRRRRPERSRPKCGFLVSGFVGFRFFVSVVLSWCLLVFVGDVGGFRVVFGWFSGVPGGFWGRAAPREFSRNMIEFLLNSGLPGRAFL